MQMKRKDFAALCEKHGVTWSVDEQEGGCLNVDPPPGHVFTDTGLHYLSHWLKGWKRAEAYAHVAEDLAGGVEPCLETDCDYCTGETERKEYLGVA